MDTIFQIDNTLPIPIYQQMVDSVRAAVKNGTLTHGQQLPTVQELSRKLGLARGTITRAYDALEQEGLVEKVQGRGTFVHCPRESSGSRKDRAMAAIEGLLNDLDTMGFSVAEVNIFLNLKLRERAEREAKVKIALVESSPETLSQIARQLREIPCAEVYSYLLGSLVQYPYNLNEEVDMILATQSQAQTLGEILPVQKRITPVALQLATDSIVSIIKLSGRDRVGILCQSDRFGQLLQRTCQTYAEEANLQPYLLVAREAETAAYLQDKQVLLIPEGLESGCPAAVKDLLRHFPGQIIRCAYELDRGSFLYVQEKSKRILDTKTI